MKVYTFREYWLVCQFATLLWQHLVNKDSQVRNELICFSFLPFCRNTVYTEVFLLASNCDHLVKIIDFKANPAFLRTCVVIGWGSISQNTTVYFQCLDTNLCLRRATFARKIQVVIDLNAKDVSWLMKTWELCWIVLLFAGGSFCPEVSQKHETVKQSRFSLRYPLVN